ncbi:MAG TPA: PLD nuclease N-terminal domain-containing protein [Microthrixaceae bacterium]|nr:PLD nuclease N-terminal domain-containing protein [Microthrixaceae bacterium]
MAKKRTWAELSTTAKVSVVVGGAIETFLTGVAIKDLVGRPSSTVRGPKWLWFLTYFVQPFGPLAYFAFGRRRAGND